MNDTRLELIFAAIVPGFSLKIIDRNYCRTMSNVVHEHELHGNIPGRPKKSIHRLFGTTRYIAM